MKCIGGELDGQSYNHVPEHFKIGDCVEIPKAKAPITADNFGSMITEYCVYRICSIRGKPIDGTNGRTEIIKFLCPQGWHEWEAIQHLFRNYRAP